MPAVQRSCARSWRWPTNSAKTSWRRASRSPEDVGLLRSIGCEFGQGFYYGEAMADRDVIQLLKLVQKTERKLQPRGFFRLTRTNKKKPKAEKRKPEAGVATPATAAGVETAEAQAPVKKGPAGGSLMPGAKVKARQKPSAAQPPIQSAPPKAPPSVPAPPNGPASGTQPRPANNATPPAPPMPGFPPAAASPPPMQPQPPQPHPMPRATSPQAGPSVYAPPPAPVPFQAAMPPPQPMPPPTFAPNVPPPAPNPSNGMPSQPQPMSRSLNELPPAFHPSSMPIEAPPLLDPEPAWLNSLAPAPSMNGPDVPPAPLPWQVTSEPVPEMPPPMPPPSAPHVLPAQAEIPPTDAPTSRGRPGQSGRPTTLPPNIAASLAKLAGKPVKSSAGE